MLKTDKKIIRKSGTAEVGKTFVFEDKTYRIKSFPSEDSVRGVCVSKDCIGHSITVKLSKIKKIRG